MSNHANGTLSVPLTAKTAKLLASTFATKAAVEVVDSEGNSVQIEVSKNDALEMFSLNPSLDARMQHIPGKTIVRLGEEKPEVRDTFILTIPIVS